MTGHRERLGVNPAHSAKHSQPSSQRVAWSYRRQEYTSKRREGKNMRKDKMLKKKNEQISSLPHRTTTRHTEQGCSPDPKAAAGSLQP